MWALVDCNSFFASVERVFHPGLKNKPVVVLSNNDGCIVALTSEAKAVGLHRGDPYFKVKGIIEAKKVAVFSTNMQLYSAMSDRITSILRKSVARVEKYSIDECFADLTGYETHYDVAEYMREIAQRIALWTDIPVSVGIAPSKTIAKMASKFAKQYAGYRGVCMIDTDEKRRKALQLFPLEDVWGIGRKGLEKLLYYRVKTPLEFADKPESWVRNHFTKPGLQTWMELNGISCIDTSEILSKQNICTSRSFAQMTDDLTSLKASVVHFASSCANKLRAQNSVCQCVSVFIYSNRFREDLRQYGNIASASLIVPSSDTIEIVKAAISALESIFLPNIMYKKAGVILSEISSSDLIQANLFDPIQNRSQRAVLMSEIDALNTRYGVKTVQLALEGENSQTWNPRCEHKSGNYITELKDILEI